ncbi:arginine/serine-rich coiled-coil protein 2-like isoform X2 [Bradysia coprophila]|uniref:arginine/serine-rich coiled-coil protein 2-like isoform X2 n=1 Tax=Bradysia coprophila TaxID=38358 RepID=UPI00187DD731|nr:arginine/serine-rich coiled-coil protein 2-like isoform X2 [Bradysia coprophila]
MRSETIPSEQVIVASTLATSSVDFQSLIANRIESSLAKYFVSISQLVSLMSQPNEFENFGFVSVQILWIDRARFRIINLDIENCLDLRNKQKTITRLTKANFLFVLNSLDSQDSDSSDARSSLPKVSDVKPKKCETDAMPQSSHRSNRHNRSDEKSSSSSKEVDRYKSDKSKESSGRDRFTEKTRDKTDKHRNRDRDRERDRDRREKGRSRPEKDDKYSRHRDNRSDSRRDRNDRTDRNDQRRSDKDRYDRGRDRHNNTRSKSKSRSRSRDNGSRDNLPPPRSYQHDRSAIKEPPKSLMSLQLPQMPLVTASVTKQITPAPTTTTTATTTIVAATAPPNLISPLLASARYTEQMQKRKLLWGNKKVEGEQQTTNNRWEQTKFSQDSDGKMATKFLRLMGMKDAPKVAEDETQKAPDSIKKQTEMLSTMEQQYEVARQMTHTMRGMGLGFGTQPRNY